MAFLVVPEGLNTTAAVLAICVIDRITALQRAALRIRATGENRSLTLREKPRAAPAPLRAARGVLLHG
jgi:uncharacterized protein with GYD domain